MCITFDDGFVNNYKYAFTLFGEYVSIACKSITRYYNIAL